MLKLVARQPPPPPWCLPWMWLCAHHHWGQQWVRIWGGRSLQKSTTQLWVNRMCLGGRGGRHRKQNQTVQLTTRQSQASQAPNTLQSLLFQTKMLGIPHHLHKKYRFHMSLLTTSQEWLTHFIFKPTGTALHSLSMLHLQISWWSRTPGNLHLAFF